MVRRQGVGSKALEPVLGFGDVGLADTEGSAMVEEGSGWREVIRGHLGS